MASKKYRRTTIELDENLYRRVKKLAVERDKTLRDIITEALEDKLRKEEELMETSNSDFMKNKIARKIVKEMERFISSDTAMVLFKSKCQMMGLNPVDIGEEDISYDLLRSLCNGMRTITLVDMDECIESLESAVGGK